MDNLTPLNLPILDFAPVDASTQVSQLSDIVAGLESSNEKVKNTDSKSETAQTAVKYEGITALLFSGLKAKHPPTAAHGLRVAFGCSMWATSINEDEEFRRTLETAALLHDIGKIGVSDKLLSKPSKLNSAELTVMSQQRLMGLGTLAGFDCFSEIVEIVALSSAWFDGSNPEFSKQGEQIPLAARMLAIVDAFDSMTTEQAYRHAFSIQDAIGELLKQADTKYDSRLIASFNETVSSHWPKICQTTSDRFPVAVESDEIKQSANKPEKNETTQKTKPDNSSSEDAHEFDRFHKVLVDNTMSGVVYVCKRQQITVWNRAMERLTGISSSCVTDKQFLPSLLGMQHESGKQILDQHCPVVQVYQTGVQVTKRVSLMGRDGEPFSAEILIVPVLDPMEEVIGATITVNDVSSRVSLEQRVESLYKRVTQDPLTSIANRAEFDRVHAEFIDRYFNENTTCSLILCDLDFFKKINDDYGHQAGDHALIHFAALMKRYQNAGDLVARYGGEEFVWLCADCDGDLATKRAEEIRHVLQATPQPDMENKCITSSFGVTEIQQGDTPETMLRRADQALRSAKEGGRNQVVQMGVNSEKQIELDKTDGRRELLSWFKGNEPIIDTSLIAHVPVPMAIQKLQGFVTDLKARIIEVDDTIITIKASGHLMAPLRRKSDRHVPFTMRVRFSKIDEQDIDSHQRSTSKTKVEVVVVPNRTRDRRRDDLAERGNQLLNSLKSYLMATAEDEEQHSMLTPAATESGRE